MSREYREGFGIEGIDFCGHAFEKVEAGQFVEDEHVEDCVVCQRRKFVVNDGFLALIFGWEPLPYEEVIRLFETMAVEYTGGKPDVSYETWQRFYAALVESKELEQMFANEVATQAAEPCEMSISPEEMLERVYSEIARRKNSAESL